MQGRSLSNGTLHHYIDREDRQPRSEEFPGDRVLAFLHTAVREHAPSLFRAATSARASWLIGHLLFDQPFTSPIFGFRFIRRTGIRMDECVHPPSWYTTPRRLFERQIRYWDCRPLDPDPGAVVSPADSRAVIGTLCEHSLLSLKKKLFHFDELFGPESSWGQTFFGGDCAVFRLTPDKYHYNHTPVSGTVIDQFQIDGAFNSCNPGAVVHLATPFSKNRRFVTIIDTDLPGGSEVGKVAMIEVAALGVGDLTQCYSSFRYEDPVPIEPGLFMEKGSPKSLFRPGSSTTVLLFEPGRVRFDDDLYQNQKSDRASSRLTIGFGIPLMETEVRVRSRIGRRVAKPGFVFRSQRVADDRARHGTDVVA